MKRTEVERPVNSWMWVRVSLIGAGRCEGKTEGTLCLLKRCCRQQIGSGRSGSDRMAATETAEFQNKSFLEDISETLTSITAVIRTVLFCFHH